MKQNFFEAMLSHELLQEPKKEIKQGRTPRETTLGKLQTDNPPLIDFLNKYNPFREAFTYTETSPLRDARTFKEIFPLQKSVYANLSQEGIDLVLERWRIGITNNIIVHQSKLLPNQMFTAEDLVNVFVEPLLSLTRDLLNGLSLAFFHDYLVLEVSRNAAKLTTEINAEAKNTLILHYTSKIKKGTFYECLLEYKSLKYKPLDDHLYCVLLGFENFTEVTNTFKNLEIYLSVSELEQKDVLEKTKDCFNLFFKSLEEEVRLHQEELLPLTETEEYKINKQKKRIVDRKISIAEGRIQTHRYQLNESLKYAMKVF